MIPPAEITVATFHAGLKKNIIPAAAKFNEHARHERRRARGGGSQPATGDSYGGAVRRCTATADRKTLPIPLLINDLETTDRVKAAPWASIGPGNVLDHPAQISSEDFGALPDPIGVPGIYWFFSGMPDEVIDGDEPVPSNHSPLFAPIIEPTLSTGVTAAYTAIMARFGPGNGGA